MVLTPSQNVIARDLHRFRVLNCGRRFGKTTLAVEEIKGKCLAKPVRIAYIAPTYQQARDIAWEILKNELRPITISVNESRLELRVKTMRGGESIIVLRGWEAVETLRGQKFDFLVIDEVASMRNFRLHWEEVLRPTLTDNIGEALFISTPKGYDHFYELFSKDPAQLKVEGVAQDDDYKSFHFTTYDNPHIPVDEINKAKREVAEDKFAQEYMADFRKMQGLVYKEFDRTRHIYTDSVVGMAVDRLVAVDFGYTNPCAIYLIEKDTDSNYFISHEYYKTQKTTPEIIEYAKSLNGNKYYPDPAEPDRIEEMRRAGLNVRDVSKEIEAGISTVRELFKQNRLHIHSSCSFLIGELETYRYPDKKPERNEPEVPIKENDHACDAIRYALHMQGKGNGQAHVHYAASAQPTHFAPKMPNAPRVAPTRYQKL